MEITTKEYKINDQEFMFRPNMRAMIEFERLACKPVPTMMSTEDHITFLYAGTVAGMRKAGKEFTLTLDDYIDLIDGDFDLLSDLMDAVDEEDSEKK